MGTLFLTCSIISKMCFGAEGMLLRRLTVTTETASPLPLGLCPC